MGTAQSHANKKRAFEARLGRSCSFCREATPKTDEERDKRRMKRVEVNNPIALCYEGTNQLKKGDYIMAFEYFTKAADLGDAEAHCKLSALYYLGNGVDKDKGKAMYHLENAAIRGHPQARYTLGFHDKNNGNMERAVKHWIIAATQVEDESTKKLMEAFKGGFISKEDLAAALRAHQAAVDATKSPQREAAEKFRQLEERVKPLATRKCSVTHTHTHTHTPHQ